MSSIVYTRLKYNNIIATHAVIIVIVVTIIIWLWNSNQSFAKGGTASILLTFFLQGKPHCVGNLTSTALDQILDNLPPNTVWHRNDHEQHNSFLYFFLFYFPVYTSRVCLLWHKAVTVHCRIYSLYTPSCSPVNNTNGVRRKHCIDILVGIR